MFATCETVGLAEWIIDDTCLVIFISKVCLFREFLNFSRQQTTTVLFSFFLSVNETFSLSTFRAFLARFRDTECFTFREFCVK